MHHMPLADADIAALTALEEAMWRPQTRFDRAFMERHLAADFIEFGRSGRTYTRAQCLAAPPQPIGCRLPLSRLQIRLLDAHTAQVLYDSVVQREGQTPEYSHRTSLWTRTTTGWVLRFHQATPFVPEATSSE